MSINFIKRLSQPESGNKYYNTTSSGGFSKCCKGNNSNGQRGKGLDVLPNCVGYSLGRFNEISKTTDFRRGIPGNAEDILENAKNLGYKTGSSPKIGAIMVWSKGKPKNSADGCGHVANVEEIVDDNTIIVSESGWSSTKLFWTAVHRKGADGNWVDGADSSWMKGKYTYLGCVYNPELEKLEEEERKAEEKRLEEEKRKAQEQLEQQKKEEQKKKEESIVIQDPNKYHVVKKGETIFSIAKLYYGSRLKYKKLKKDNNLKSLKLKVGQTLIILK